MYAVALLVVALIILSAPARADTPPRRAIQLEVQQNGLLPSCQVEQRLRSALVRRLGYDPIDSTAGEHLDIRLFRMSAQEIAAYLELRGTGGAIVWQRFYAKLPPNGCGELVDSATLGLELAFIKGAQKPSVPGPAPKPPEPCSPSPSCPPCAPAPSCPVEPPPAPDEDPGTFALQASLGPELLFGPLPAMAGGGAVGLALRGPFAVIGLEGRISGPAVNEVPPEREILAWLATASLVPCLRAWAFDGCGVVSVGALHALGRGIDVPEAGSQLYAAAGLRLAALVPLHGSFLLRPYVEMTFPLRPIKIGIDDNAVWMTPPTGAIVGLSLVAEFLPRDQVSR